MAERCGVGTRASRTREGATIQVKYLSAIRDRTGRRSEDVDLLPGATLEDLADWLNERYGLTVPGPGIMAVLNGRGWGQYPSKLGTEIREGDVVCLFPPISGG